MDKKRIIELYELLAANKASLEERTEFERMLKGEGAESVLKDFWDKHWDGIMKSGEENIVIKNYEKIFDYIAAQPQKQKAKKSWFKYATAASIVLSLSVTTYLALHKKDVDTTSAVNTRQDIKPGRNGAILTLSNGQRIVLEQAKKGVLANQNGTQLNKTDDSLLVYKAGEEDQGPLAYNTLETPKGRQYSVVLSDGSKVWLNAASSLKYPTAFTGNERKVELLYGEAYFEVIHNQAKPFRVISNSQVVEDMGTHFNINAYSDEPGIKTTLLEGSVEVSNQHNSKILKPGQQAFLQGNQFAVNEANMEEAVAWRNGYFRFNDENIHSVMRQLARWYNVDIQYQGNITTDGLNGKISRFKNISQVLRMFESTKLVHFKIEGRRIMVMQ